MQNAPQQVRELIALAVRQIGHAAHTPVGFSEPTAYIPKPAAVSGVLGLDSSELPKLLNENGRLVRVPVAALGAKSLKLSAAIAELSLVAQAGAHLIIRPEQDSAIPTGHKGIVALKRAASSFNTIDAATFSTVPDDVDLLPSVFPVHSAAIDWSTAAAMGVRFEVGRQYQKQVGVELIAEELMLSVVLGIARAADAALLAAINVNAPAPFTLGGAAARGIRFGELRSLIGSAGNGAAIGQDGALRALGVPAELTPDMVGTVIGAFNRSAVAIHEEISLHVERRNTQGDLIVTAWMNLIPLVPEAGAFFSAGA